MEGFSEAVLPWQRRTSSNREVQTRTELESSLVDLPASSIFSLSGLLLCVPVLATEPSDLGLVLAPENAALPLAVARSALLDHLLQLKGVVQLALVLRLLRACWLGTAFVDALHQAAPIAVRSMTVTWETLAATPAAPPARM
jgi:hypothetical protein